MRCATDGAEIDNAAGWSGWLKTAEMAEVNHRIGKHTSCSKTKWITLFCDVIRLTSNDSSMQLCNMLVGLVVVWTVLRPCSG